MSLLVVDYIAMRIQYILYLLFTFLAIETRLNIAEWDWLILD